MPRYRQEPVEQLRCSWCDRRVTHQDAYCAAVRMPRHGRYTVHPPICRGCAEELVRANDEQQDAYYYLQIGSEEAYE